MPASLILLAAGFHLWFIRHAKEMLMDMVEKKSHGKLKLDIGRLRYNYFTHEMNIRNAVFYSVDSATATTAHRFEVKEIHVRLQGLLPFVLRKKLLIDSINLQSPDIRVTTMRYSDRSGKKSSRDISIPYEMGKIYQSIQEVLEELKVEKFQIDNGRFSLLNKASPDQQPVFITRINFHIDNLLVGGSPFSEQDQLFFSENVTLNTKNQEITFPDGRHMLAFRAFEINLKNRRVSFDSCTITGNKTDSNKAAFSVFFDKLQLANIDFDTLYKSEVIKADTVICENPTFTIRVNLGTRKDSAQRRPKLETLIEQLTGDLLLGYVKVNNAAFDITTFREGRPSSFHSRENNFEMRGLTINQGANKPVHVDSFAMAIRNYENFLKDSSYQMQFDSVLFRDNRIFLSNFIYNRFENGKAVHSINIPRFYLGGLSWDALVFDRKLMADQATLFNPTIRYKAMGSPGQKRKSQDIFQALGEINDFMDLQYLDIVDGNIDVELKNHMHIRLEQARLGIQSHALLHAGNMAAVKNAVNILDFENGSIQAGNIKVAMKKTHYAGNSGQWRSSELDASNTEGSFRLTAKNASVEKMKVNEITGDLEATGISWDHADLHVLSDAIGKPKDLSSILNLTSLSGKDTRITIKRDDSQLFTVLENVSFRQLEKYPGSPLKVTGLIAAGSEMTVNKPDFTFSLGAYQYNDLETSRAKAGRIIINGKNQSRVSVSFPSFSFTPVLEQLLNGNYNLADVYLFRPRLYVNPPAYKESTASNMQLPVVSLHGVKLEQPFFEYGDPADTTRLLFTWNGEAGQSDYLSMDEFRSGPKGIETEKLSFFMTHTTIKTRDNRIFTMKNGSLSLLTEWLRASRDAGGKWGWSATVDHMEGKNFNLAENIPAGPSMRVDRFKISSLSLNSDLVKATKWFIRENPKMELTDFYGSYTGVENKLQWYGAGFHKSRGLFTADSLVFTPMFELEEFVKRHPYEKDYVTIHTGKISLDHIEPMAYLRDGTIKAGLLQITDLNMSDFRDKRPPMPQPKYKPLPAAILKRIPIKFSLDSLKIPAAKILYTEVNEKTGLAGAIPVTQLNIRAYPLHNTSIHTTDSLRIQADALLIDSLVTRFRYAESYSDSLNGFIETVQAKGTDLLFLNKVLGPISSVELQSAVLDSLSMRVSGNDVLAYGKMNFYYRDLKVRFLQNGQESKRGFLKSLQTFIANSFVIKNKNTRRTGRVFFIRMNDRSAVQYLVKTIFSGVANSVGAKNNKKLMRRYNKDLKERHLPPVDFN